MAPSGGSSSVVPSLPPPRPKSPPEYPDLYGKRRELAKVQMLEREISFLQEELKSVDGLQPASRCCKEVADFVVANSDPFLPASRRTRRPCRFWKWLCGMSCFNISSCFSISWRCCCECSPRLKLPRCCCCCHFNLCDCLSCVKCSIPKCQCCTWHWPNSKCFNKLSCRSSCCILQCPSCPDCCCSCPNCPSCPDCCCSCPDCPSCSDCCCSCPDCPSCPDCCCSCPDCSCSSCTCKYRCPKCTNVLHCCRCITRNCCCPCYLCY